MDPDTVIALKSLGKNIYRYKRKKSPSREEGPHADGRVSVDMRESIFGGGESICGQRGIIYRHRESIQGHREPCVDTEHLWAKGAHPDTLGEHP